MDAAYFTALAADHDLGRTRGIDATLQMFGLDAILLPTDGPCNLSRAFLTTGIKFRPIGFTSGPAAIAGYPIVTGIIASIASHTLSID